MDTEVKNIEVKSIADMRMGLAEQISALRAKPASAVNCNAMTNASGKIISSIKLELQIAKESGRPIGGHTFVPLAEVITSTLKDAQAQIEARTT